MPVPHLENTEQALAWLKDKPSRILTVRGDPRPLMSSLEVAQKLAFRHFAPSGEVVWLHDGPGTLAQGSFLQGRLALLSTPGTLIVSGPAIDAVHPELSAVLTLPGTAPDRLFEATHVELPPVAQPMDGMLETLRSGDLLLAHAYWESIQARDPSVTVPYRWIGLQRLLHDGRLDELLERALSQRTIQDDTGRILLLVAEVTLKRGLPEQARTLLQALLRDHPAHADAHCLLALLEARPPIPEHLDAQTPWRRQRIGAGLAAGITPVGPSVFETSPFAKACLDVAIQQVKESTLETLLAMGHADVAAIVLRRSQRSSTAIRALRAHRPADILDRTHRALRRRHVEGARLALEALPSELFGVRSRDSQLAALYQAVVRGAQDDLAGFLAALTLCERMLDGRHLPDILDELLPLLDLLPHWPASRLLAFLHAGASTNALQTRVIQAAAALPNRDLPLDVYSLDHAVAVGGMGEVWKATHASLGRPVAVKVLKPGSSPHLRDQFVREVDLTTRLEHPGIVSVLDYGTIPPTLEAQSNGRLVTGQPYLVMEYASGGTLEEKLGTLSWDRVLAILRVLLDALHYAHGRGLVHRDIKPPNVLFTEEGEPRLTDFGLSVLDPGKVAGTPTYMAPEQFMPGPTDARCDLYAIGCLAWAMVSGAPPFVGTLQELRDGHMSRPLPTLCPAMDLAPGFTRWLTRMLEKRPEKRFQTAREALHALDGRSPRPGELPIALDEVSHQLHLRPRIPTTHLQDRGDPPYLGHVRQRQMLWNMLLAVHDGGQREDVFLDGEPGVGRHLLVAWLRRTARRQGVLVGAEPGLHLAILGDDAPDGPGPWLVVHTRPRPGAPRIAVPPLQFHEAMQAALARIPLSFHTAVHATYEAHGRQEVLYDLLSGWQQTPGYAPSRAGLVLLRADQITPSVRAVRAWTRILTNFTSEEVDGLSLAALLAPGFQRSTLEAACSAANLALTPSALALLLPVGEGWTLPHALRAALHHHLGPRAFDAHHLLATITHHEHDAEVRRWMHATQGGQPVAPIQIATRAQEAFLDRRLAPPSTQAMEVARLALDAMLEHDPEARMWVELSRAMAAPTELARKRLTQLYVLCRRAERTLGAGKALEELLVLAGRDGTFPLPEDHVLQAVRQLPPEPASALRMGIARLWAQKDPSKAERMLRRTLDELKAQVPDATSAAAALHLALAEVSTDRAVVLRHAQLALEGSALPSVRSDAILLLAQLRLKDRDGLAALELLAQVRHPHAGRAGRLKALAHLLLGEGDKARAPALLALVDHARFAAEAPGHDHLLVALLAHPDWPRPLWEAAVAQLGPVSIWLQGIVAPILDALADPERTLQLRESAWP